MEFVFENTTFLRCGTFNGVRYSKEVISSIKLPKVAHVTLEFENNIGYAYNFRRTSNALTCDIYLRTGTPSGLIEALTPCAKVLANEKNGALIPKNSELLEISLVVNAADKTLKPLSGLS